MSKNIFKYAAVSFVLLIALAVCWAAGYYQGYMGSRITESNVRFREMRSQALTALKSQNITNIQIDRGGYGNVILRGELTTLQIENLRLALTQQFGEDYADGAVFELKATNDGSSQHREFAPE
jgi:ABC-type multidrug transport system fused ATPase/permease subunit